MISNNGDEKRIVLDLFGFLSDCLKHGVAEACELNERGGIEKILSKEPENEIHFLISFQYHDQDSVHIYGLIIGQDKQNKPYVDAEILFTINRDNAADSLYFKIVEGQGILFKNQNDIMGIDIPIFEKEKFLDWIENRFKDGKSDESADYIEFEDTNKLGIVTLSSLKQNPQIVEFTEFLMGCCFKDESATEWNIILRLGQHPCDADVLCLF